MRYFESLTLSKIIENSIRNKVKEASLTSNAELKVARKDELAVKLGQHLFVHEIVKLTRPNYTFYYVNLSV